MQLDRLGAHRKEQSNGDGQQGKTRHHRNKDLSGSKEIYCAKGPDSRAVRGTKHHEGLYIAMEVLFFQTGRNRSRSEEHTSELQSLMRISYAVCCWNKKK